MILPIELWGGKNQTDEVNIHFTDTIPQIIARIVLKLNTTTHHMIIMKPYELPQFSAEILKKEKTFRLPPIVVFDLFHYMRTTKLKSLSEIFQSIQTMFREYSQEMRKQKMDTSFIPFYHDFPLELSLFLDTFLVVEYHERAKSKIATKFLERMFQLELKPYPPIPSVPAYLRNAFYREFNDDMLSLIETEFEKWQDRSKQLVKEADDLWNNYESPSMVNIGPTVLDGYRIEIELKCQQTLGELFQKMKLTLQFPCARYKDLYQLSCPTFHVNEQSTDELASFQDNFSDKTPLTVWDADGHVTLIMIKDDLNHVRMRFDVDQNQTIDARLALFDFEKKNISKSNKIGIRGSFQFQDTCFDPVLFADYMMNEKFPQRYMYNQESNRASRRHGSLYTYFLSPFFNQKIPILIADNTLLYNLEPQGIQSRESFTYAKSRYGLVTSTLQCVPNPENPKSKYSVSIRVLRCLNEDILDYYRHMFSVIYGYYLQEYTTLLPLYQTILGKKYSPIYPLWISRKSDNRKALHLSKKYPRLFTVPLYSRTCQREYPNIISDEAATEIEDDKKMKYPSIPIEEIQPEWYVCPSGQKFQYPGLTKFEDEKAILGYVPCCFEKPQTTKSKKIIQEIEKAVKNGLPARSVNILKKGNILYPIKTQKLIHIPGQRGYLPNELYTFFIGFPSFANKLFQNQEFVRFGVMVGPASLVECCELYYSQTHKTTKRSLSLLKTLITDKKEMHDPSFFWKPEMVQRTLEAFFGISLLFFYRDRDDKMTILRSDSYESYSTKNPIVCIYVHWGGENDLLANRSYPQCELMALYTKDHVDFDLIPFSEKPRLWNTLFHWFQGSNIQFPFSMDIIDVQVFQKLPLQGLHHQWVDDHDNARILFSSIGSSLVPFFCTKPIPRLAELPIMSLTKFSWSICGDSQLWNVIDQFEKWISVGSTKTNLLCIEFQLGQINVMVPLSSKPLREYEWTGPLLPLTMEHRQWLSENFPLHKKWITSFTQSPSTSLQELIYLLPLKPSTQTAKVYHSEKMANIIMEYGLVFLAHYCQEHQKQVLKYVPTEDEWMDTFMDTYCQIERHVSYPEVSELHPLLFHSQKGLLTPHVHDGPFEKKEELYSKKLVVSSKIASKLKQFLLWTFWQNPSFVENVSEWIEIPSYYTTFIDYARPEMYFCRDIQSFSSLYEDAQVRIYDYDLQDPYALFPKYSFFWQNSFQNPLAMQPPLLTRRNIANEQEAFKYYQNWKHHHVFGEPLTSVLTDNEKMNRPFLKTWNEKDEKFETFGILPWESNNKNVFYVPTRQQLMVYM